MELEIVRMCAAAAADPTIGVNAMLDTIAVHPGDVTPPRMTIYNSMDHGWVARRQVTDALLAQIDLPCLAVFSILDADLENVLTVTRDGHFNISFAYLEREADTSKGKRDAAYTMRAVLRFLTRFVDNADASMRKLNGVQLVRATATKQPPMVDKWESAIVMASTVVDFFARETSASGS